MTSPTDPTAGLADSAAPSPRTYAVRTLGCQMNLHDSEHIAGLLEAAGYVPAARAGSTAGDGAGLPRADVVVINTCAVRENAASRLYGNLGQLAAVKQEHPDMQIAVGGCLAQKDRAGIIKRAPWVDVVFGTHTIDTLPALLDRARHNRQAEIEIAESLRVFPSTLPTKRESVYAGWVSISVGCNNTCTFCIVPSLRGRERDRQPSAILAEVAAVVADGAIEITLLGQNVNSYGSEFGDRGAFAKLLRAVGATPGLERLRFTSPHPAAFTRDVIAAMAEVPTVMPQLHMPLQSGSDAILRAMRRSYRADRFLTLLDEIRTALPDAAISTDIIVGFPGESEADFAATLGVVEQARFASAFTFLYSSRPGTPAAAMANQVSPDVASERYGRLIALQDRIAEEEAKKLVGRDVEVLIAQGEGRKDAETRRLSGRARDNRLVHLALPPDLRAALDAGRSDLRLPRPGDMVTVTVTRGAPHHLTADSALTGGRFEVRRTRAGDAWQAAQPGSAPSPGQIALGMPSIGRLGQDRPKTRDETAHD